MLDRFRAFLSEATPAQRAIFAIYLQMPFLLAFILAPGVGLVVPSLTPLLDPFYMIAGGLLIVLAMVIQLGMLVWLRPRRLWVTPLPRVYAAIAVLATIGFSTTAFLGGNLTYPANLVIIGLVPCGLLLLDMRSTAIGLAVGVLIVAVNDLAIFTGLVPYAPGYGPQAFENGQHHFMAEVLRSGIQYVIVLAYGVLIWLLFGHYDFHQKTLTLMSQLDVLTGLANRRYFMERLERECARLGRNDYPLSLVLIDADHFKRINDTHGHLLGDQVLRSLGDILREHMRVPTDVPARIGGEEFAVLLPDTSLAGAKQVCQRIQDSLARITFQGVHGPFKVSLSMGVVESHGHSAEALLHYADANLYLAKAQGRNRIVATALSQEGQHVRAPTLA